MKKLLFWALALGLGVYLLSPQWQSLERMGMRRYATLGKPQKELVVGVSWPFDLRKDGMADGLKLALDEINEGKLTGGLPIRLVLRDDHNDWKTGRKIAMEFADTPEMTAVLGYYDDSVAIRASPIFEATRLLQICVNANSPAMTSHGYKYIIRTVQSTNQIAQRMAEASVIEGGSQKIAMVWQEDAYGKDLVYQYRITQDGLGGQVVFQWPYPTNHTDFRLPINQLRSVDADFILLSAQDADVADFLRKADSVGLTVPIMVASDLSLDLKRMAGPAIKRGKFLELYDVTSQSPKNRRFVEKFRARFGVDPDTSAAQGYDALYLLAEAARRTNSNNPLDLSFSIRFMPPWEGVNGVYQFDSDGELMEKPLRLVDGVELPGAPTAPKP